MQNELLYHLIDLSFKRKTDKFDSRDELELTKIIFENGLVGLLFETIDKSSFKTYKIPPNAVSSIWCFCI